MENKEKAITWSSSRVSTFVNCPLRYKFQYVEKWKATPEPPNSELANKGLAAHETFEAYRTGMPKEELYKILESKIKEYNVDTEKYSYDSAMEKFFSFWNTFIASREKEGWIVSQEGKVFGQLDNENFMGILDLVVYNDDNIEIFDYKTSKSSNVNYYKNQMLVYAYLKGKEKNWNFKEIVERVKIRLFFPLIDDLENKSVEQNMLRGVKEVTFNENELKEVVNEYFNKNISTIKGFDFSKAQGNITHACSWCPYCGAKANDSGFEGCAMTVAAGFVSPDGTFFVKSETK